MYQLIRKITEKEKLINLLATMALYLPGSISLSLCRLLSILIKRMRRPLFVKTLQNMVHILHPYYKLRDIRTGCHFYFYNLVLTMVEILLLSRTHLANNGVLVLFGDFWRRDFPPSVMFQKTTRLPRGAAGLALDLGVR